MTELFTRKERHILLAGIAGVTLSGLIVAGAQTTGDLESAVTQGAQYDEAQRQSDRLTTRYSQDAMLDGEPGVFIMKVNDIYSFGAAFGAGHSTNPGRALDVNTQESAYASLALTAGVNTQIAGQIDAGANLVVSGTDYIDNPAIDNRNAIASTYAGKSVINDRIYLNATASYGVNADGDFENDTAFYGISGTASSVFKVADSVLLRPSLGISRQWSENEAQENTAASANVLAIWAPDEKWRLAGQAGYTKRNFDNFYEDVTFVEREDDVVTATLSVSRQMGPDVDATASVTYTTQDSAFFLSEYEAVDSGLNVRLTKRF